MIESLNYDERCIVRATFVVQITIVSLGNPNAEKSGRPPLYADHVRLRNRVLLQRRDGCRRLPVQAGG